MRRHPSGLTDQVCAEQDVEQTREQDVDVAGSEGVALMPWRLLSQNKSAIVP
jgi:hypothetical protein